MWLQGETIELTTDIKWGLMGERQQKDKPLCETSRAKKSIWETRDK